MKKEFYSNGKLLITGEYLVLDGAKGFALPTKFGQNLIVENGANRSITWKSYDSDGSIWLDVNLTFLEILNKDTNDKQASVKNTLIEILHAASLLNPDFIENSEGYNIITHLTFPKNWGLGTSSTLINNIAQWLQINAFVLLKNSFGGSGYDIACAQNNSPIVYHLDMGKPVVEKVTFHPDFKNNLYFVYLDKKQNSKSAIAAYYNNRNENLSKNIAKIDLLTHEVLTAKTLREFATALDEHEAEMSNILEMQTIKESLFSDFNGVIKSLGAWGGDFVLAISKENPTAYFEKRGYRTIISYKEMIL
ncbi:GYDIA family GHMP kinase [Flavobacterium cellulosilyticum]|uniref:GHMP kinase n=1 Tax=Flavobacterium cellulosilyticum TaxID=2541731 RepID=A0A4R5CJB6_9FLAO|nr:GYDIA family GHMP kinase [Flavobacterium cellulosilyticum]TDD99236.1 GHMP kinase [Flavobacterium cellulosilyticum]